MEVPENKVKNLQWHPAFYAGIQIIVTESLSEVENLWLKSLTDHLTEHNTIKKLVKSYEKHQNDNLYRAMMNVIVRANKEKFREEDNMCEAMEEILKDRIEARERKSEQIGKQIGKEIGEKLGKRQINELNKKLARLGRISDIIRATEDKEYQDKLIKEFGL